jgi:hypothetical protein
MSLHVSAHGTILRRYINNLTLLNYALYMDPYISLSLIYAPSYAQIVFYTALKMFRKVFKLIKSLKILN